jgi:hypothetical protein
MTVFAAFLADDNAADMNVLTLVILRKPPLVLLLAWDAVVPDKRISKGENLAAVAGVGHGFGVADHAGIEDNFSIRIDVCAKRLATEYRAVCKNEASHIGAECT